MEEYPILLSLSDFNNYKKNGQKITLLEATGHKHWNGSRFEVLTKHIDAEPQNSFRFDVTQYGKTHDDALYPIPDKRDLTKYMKDREITLDSWLVISSTNSIAWATRAWWLFSYNGFKRVSILDPERTLHGNKQPPQTIKTKELTDAIPNKLYEIIDLRHPDEFSGKKFKGQGYPGHIPSSKNLFVRELLNEHGHLKTLTELKQVIPSHLCKGLPIVATCGGGTAATVFDVTLRILGINPPLIYDGSMHAWTASSNREVHIC